MRSRQASTSSREEISPSRTIARQLGRRAGEQLRHGRRAYRPPARSSRGARAPPRSPEALEQLVGEGQVVRAQVGRVVEDRHAALGRLGVAHAAPDHRVEHLLAEALLQLHLRLARVDEPHVGDVQHHAEPLEVGVQRLLRQLHHLQRLLHALEREVLGLAGDQRVVGGHERVDGQQAERRRAVDQDQVVAALEVAQRPLQRQLAAHLAAQHQLRLGQPEVGRQDAVVDRVDRLGLAGEHVGDGRGRRRRARRSSRTGCPAGRGRRTSTSRPTRRKTSASVRTVVVFPVPPF